MRLNLGCGLDKRDGYLNCDQSTEVKPDLLLDLEAALPFQSDSVSEVLANHVLEHVHRFAPLMHELYRVCKHGAAITIRVPFYSSWGQFNDPTHVRFFTPFTFKYFSAGNYSHEVGAAEDMFMVKKVHLNFSVGSVKMLNFLLNPLLNLSHRVYCRFFAYLLPAAEIHYELQVVKRVAAQIK